jgi:protein SCO1
VRWSTLAALLGAAACGASLGIGFAITHGRAAAVPSPLRAQATWSPGGKRAPSFRLRDERGAPLSLSSQRGKFVMLAFLDSRCHGECPVEGRALATVGRRLAGTTDVELLVVTVDPWADTAASARAFASKSGWTLPWHWLLGRPAQLRPVWSSYQIAVRPTKADILHTLALYLIDRRGYQRAVYLFPFVPTEVASDARALAAS